jgi:AAA+ superfamily predicted ATPase
MTGPYESDGEHLWDELARVEHLVRARLVAWHRLLASTGKPPELWGLVHVSEEEVAAYLEQGCSPPERRSSALTDLISPFRAAYRLACRQVEERRAATPDAGSLRLMHLVTAFGLDRLELDLLLLATLPELDGRYRLVFGYLQNDASRTSPSVELLTEILEVVAPDRAAVAGRLAAGGRLRLGGLLWVGGGGGPPGRREVAVDERVLRFLLGDDTAGDGPLQFLRRVPARDWTGYVASAPRMEQLENLAEWCSGRARDGGGTVVLHGPRGSGRATTAAALTTGAGIPLLGVDVAAVRTTPEPWPLVVDLLHREARLQGAALLWQGVDVLFAGGDPTSDWQLLLTRAAEAKTLTFLSTVEREPAGPPSHSAALRLAFPPPDHRTRLRLWHECLPAEGEFVSPAPDRCGLAASLARAFQLTPGQVVDAVATARATATAREPALGLLRADDLVEGCRIQSGRKLMELAERVEPRPGLSFENLVLGRPNRRQLDELRTRIALRGGPGEAGLDHRAASGQGLLVLFTGSSGTGKTMAAELLAQERGVDLYKVDLAEVVSKYVGETEKNLRRVLAEAEDANALVFFDEADALFGKRGEVREAKDRWANMEVNFLLQRIERFAGIVILATNLRQNIDEAFMRRIHVLVEFPFPDATGRLAIWRGTFPPAEQMARPTDEVLRELAARFQLSGGSIRNVVVDAGFRALDAGEVPPRITARHLAASLAREYQKLGKPLTVVEFGAELYRWIEEDVLMSARPGG